MSRLEISALYTALIKTPARDIKAFLQDGFYCYRATGALHRHIYAELHFVLGGDADFSIGRDRIHVEDGHMLMIPPRTMHACLQESEGVRHTAFQVDLPCDGVRVLPVSPIILREFYGAIDNCVQSGDHGEVSAYMALLCHPLTAETAVPVRQTLDYGFLIQEFFSRRYREDIHLSDLAELLCLSERQTERAVLSHTGKTFRRELTATRMAVARHLMETTELSLQEIAAYVGYESYVGFWKAFKKEGGNFF
jgi:AraC-like DNA-binding protein